MSKLFKNALKLMSGSIVAQLISVLTIPIITRIFGAEDFGLFSIVLSIATILATIYLVGMHLAILIPKSEIEAVAIVRFILLIGITLSLVSLFIIFIFYDNILEIISINLDYVTLISIPLLAFSLMLGTLISFWGVRVKEYSLTSKSKVIESVAERGGSILLGVCGYTSSWTLILFKGLAVFFATLYFLMFSRTKSNSIQVAIKEWPFKKVCVKYKNYLLFNTPSSILTTFSLQIPLILIGLCFGPVYAGFFAMANRLLNIPGQTLGASISKLVTQDLSECWLRDKELATQRTRTIYTAMLQLLLYPFILLAITGDKVTLIFLGAGWLETGGVVQILTVLALTNLLVQCFGGIFDITEQQNQRLMYHIINTIIRILSIIIPSYLGYDFEVTIVVFALTGALMNFIALGLILSFVNCSLLTAFKNVRLFLSLIVIAIVSYYLNIYITSPLLFISLVSALLIIAFCFFSLGNVLSVTRSVRT
ncbi:conserved membrane hypothetical protein [Vibrio chagasii]|nr:conserved membrane hypothetical protein [Vibrio chagasii]